MVGVWICRALWKTLGQFLKKLQIEPPHDPAILLLGVRLKKWKQDLKAASAPLCSQQHYSQQPRHGDNLTVPQWVNGYRKCEVNEWRKNMECHSSIKKKEILLFVTTWKDLESIMLSEVSQTAKNKYCVFLLTGVKFSFQITYFMFLLWQFMFIVVVV